MTLRNPGRGTTLAAKKMTLEDTYLLCVEPQKPHKLFQINLGTQAAEEIRLPREHRIDNKIAREMHKMDQLLDRDTHEGDWFFQNETAKSYRLQMVPFYLLEVESDQYPVYVDNSNIDESLTKDFKIGSININMSASITETLAQGFQRSGGQYSSSAAGRSQGGLSSASVNYGHSRPQGYGHTPADPQESDKRLASGAHAHEVKPPPPQMEIFDVSCIGLEDISLLTTADKLIKMCEKKVEKQAKGRQFPQDSNRKQILKFKNVDSYLYGETQLIYFVEVRQFLRSKEEKEALELVFISLNVSDMNNAPAEGRGRGETAGYEFPPILPVSGKMRLDAAVQPPAREAKRRPSDSDFSAVGRREDGSFLSKQPGGVGKGAGTIVDGGAGHRGATVKGGAKTLEDSIASRYRHVSLFGWYAPEQLSTGKAPASLAQQHYSQERQDSAGPDSTSTVGSPAAQDQAGPSARPTPYQSSSSSAISQQKKSQGNVPVLRDPDKGFLPYNAGHEILKSCDINFPLKINLLCVRDLARGLLAEVSNPHKGTEDQIPKIPLMTYVVPQEPVCNEVQGLLAECAALNRGQHREDQNLKHNLVHPLGNHGANRHFAEGFGSIRFLLPKPKGKAKMRSVKPFQMIPQYIQVQAALYLGCKRISCFSYSKPTLYGNEIDFSGDFLQFYKPKTENKLQKQKEQADDVLAMEARGDLIRVNCLPSCARLCLNVILIPEPGSCKILKPDKRLPYEQKLPSGPVRHYFTQKEGFVLGSCQVSLFDESFLIRQGRREMRLWPLEMYNPRMVCQGECFNRAIGAPNLKPGKINQCMALQIEFQSFAGKVGWRLQRPDPSQSERDVPQRFHPLGEQKINTLNPLKPAASRIGKGRTQITRVDLEQETESLKQVKKLLDAYPLDLEDEEAEHIEVDTVLEYRNYIHKLPIFIKLIDFTDHEKIRKCYETLESSNLSKDMLPEEALALLDGLFGDIKVRIFAVKKLSMLNDSQIALFMPQLVQALKYELFHHSPLAEFLLEKALNNTRVVGHAFFWALKANLHEHQPHSRERFFLILERFLMCCGQFKNDFFKQNLVNLRLVSVFGQVKAYLAENSRKATESELSRLLNQEAVRIKMLQQLVITHGRFDDMVFHGGRLVPRDRLATTEPAQQTEHEQEESGQGEADSYLASHSQSQHRGSVKSSADRTGGQRRPSAKAASTGSKSSERTTYAFNAAEIAAFVEAQVEAMDCEGGEPPKDIYYRHLKVDWSVELIYVPFNPKTPLASFARKESRIFMSKQIPLLIVINLATEGETEAALRAQNSMHAQLDPQFLQGLEDRKQEEEQSLQRFEADQKGKPGQHGSGQLLLPRIPTHDDEDNQLYVAPQAGGGSGRPGQGEAKEERVQKKFLFKNGDDLRQDNLVLQFFKIMDRLWQAGSLELQMICYEVMESGHEMGYIEFVDDAQVITRMHWDQGCHEERGEPRKPKKGQGYGMSFWRGPFDKESVMRYVLNRVCKRDSFCLAPDQGTVRRRLDDYHEKFLHSLAGQCVATYVLGIRDRHPGNFMLQHETGKFFHIDFGHFLGHGKLKLGFNRDREPFIFSDELHYFLKYFGEVRIEREKENRQKSGKGGKDEAGAAGTPGPGRGSADRALLPDAGVTAETPLAGGQAPRDLDTFAGASQPYGARGDGPAGADGTKPLYRFDITLSDPSKKLKLKKRGTGGDDKEGRREELYRDRQTVPYRPPEWFEDRFETLASRAFLEIRQNADVFINLLILMLVSDLDELDQQSIGFIKGALFLNVSEEEATVSFKQEIDHARKQWFRPFDNLAHVLNDEKKERKALKKERERQARNRKKEKK